MEELLHTRFVERAQSCPDSIAIRTPDDWVTYGDLMDRSLVVARQLAGRGIGLGDLVAVHLQRGVDMFAAVLGVLQAGAAYLPLDVSDPIERSSTIVKDASPAAVLSHEPAVVGDLDVPALTLAELVGLEAIPASPGPADLAYVIYTSGSTGAPKGVEIRHRSVAALFEAMDVHVRVDPGDVWLSVTSPAFDISVFEFFWTLGAGMTVEIADTAGTKLFETALAQPDHDITHMQATPTLLAGLVLDPATARGLGRLQHLTCTGEALPPALARTLRDLVPGALVNAYGPTEATIWSSVEHLEAPVADPLAIGRPLAGQDIRVLDDRLGRVRDGDVGELCIAGSGVAKGYRGRPDLDKGRFVLDPEADVPDSRIYRTGDLGYRLPDGRLVCLGRSDRQVKVRGHRIELDEVEQALAAPGSVQAAAVVLDGQGPFAKLVAFVVASDQGLDAATVRAAVATQLPVAAVPADIRFVARLPVTAGGKIDRQQLAAELDQPENSPNAST